MISFRDEQSRVGFWTTPSVLLNATKATVHIGFNTRNPYMESTKACGTERSSCQVIGVFKETKSATCSATLHSMNRAAWRFMSEMGHCRLWLHPQRAWLPSQPELSPRSDSPRNDDTQVTGGAYAPFRARRCGARCPRLRLRLASAFGGQ